MTAEARTEAYATVVTAVAAVGGQEGGRGAEWKASIDSAAKEEGSKERDNSETTHGDVS